MIVLPIDPVAALNRTRLMFDAAVSKLGVARAAGDRAGVLAALESMRIATIKMRKISAGNIATVKAVSETVAALQAEGIAITDFVTSTAGDGVKIMILAAIIVVGVIYATKR